jgi:transcriptional regulator with XRE-family HTH domain
MLKIRELRNKKGWTLEQLAEKSGVSKRMVSAYEADENDIPYKKMQKIATALGVPIFDLFDENSISPQTTTCTNPECVLKIKRLEHIIDELIDDKVRLKKELDILVQKGGPQVSEKRSEGDMDQSGQAKAG